MEEIGTMESFGMQHWTRVQRRGGRMPTIE